MSDLLFEIGTEELPSWYVVQAQQTIGPLLSSKLAAAQLGHGAVSAYATPRRIAVVVRDVAATSETRLEKRRGPSVEVAFDAAGEPTRAAAGFAKSLGLEPSELSREQTDKGDYVFAQLARGGEKAADLLPALLADLVAELPAPQKMRWADIEVPFVRPIAWLVALFGDAVLPVEVAGLRAGRKSRGHRFLAPDDFDITAPGDYVAQLKDAYVLADPHERQQETWQQALAAAEERGLSPIRDTDLLEEVASLIEWPVGVLGGFADAYLDLPEEVLITVMIHHQRYFPLRGEDGRLAPNFVSISNNRVPDHALIRSGYEHVLAGRLSDARFFWQADRRESLSQHAWGLSGIGFQKQLGSMADKISRVEQGATQLAERLELSADEREVLGDALPVFRADLNTEMVYEFPELEGVMAKAYALADGFEPAVAEALEHGVRPKSHDAPLPTSRVGAVLAVADRADKLLGFFAIDKRPSGSADPFGLRRDGIALARILNAQGWSIELSDAVAAAARGYASSGTDVDADVQQAVVDFVWDRVGALLAEEGIDVRLVRAAVADHPPVITAARRSHLLAALSDEDEFGDLLTLYRRAANLAAEADPDVVVDTDRFSSEYEAPLHRAIGDARDALSALMSKVRRTLVPWDLGQGPARELSDIEAEIRGVLELKAPLDAFLDNVLVKVDDAKVRRNRLALLREVRDALRALGALENLEGMAA